MDPVLDDPGELLRFWLWHEYKHSVRSFKMANLAKSLHAKPAAVSAWLARHAIPSYYWNPIARHFKGDGATYRQLEDEARALWVTPANRRGYTPLRETHKKRSDLAAMVSAASAWAPSREHPETPALVADYRASSGAAKRRRPRQPPARRATARKSHGRKPGA